MMPLSFEYRQSHITFPMSLDGYVHVEFRDSFSSGQRWVLPLSRETLSRVRVVSFRRCDLHSKPHAPREANGFFAVL
jgi:hypothetical protein